MDTPVNKGNGNAKGRMFKSPILEALTKTSPGLTLGTYVPIMAGLLFLGNYYVGISLGQAVIWYFSGLFFWTIMEYFMHRYFYHFVDEREWTKKLHYAVHGIHHDYPRDEERLFMPPVPGIMYASVFFLIFGLILGKHVFYFLPGLMNGYLMYSFTHWAIHTFQPPKLLAPLWKHHNLHHYKYPDKAFGVSSMLWDYVFGTIPPDPAKEKK
jgi:4-hydroxysphinganine ceramide fatty acyl 2-hydroxylase